jgi:hypothetical protein
VTPHEDALASQFERECSLIVCYSTVEKPSNIWYVDSGASSHMSGVRDNFTNLIDPEIKLEIVLGDNTIVMVVGHGTIYFQRELIPPLVFRDGLYVPELKKNLISFFSIHDKGF